MTSAQGHIFLKEHEFGFHPTVLGFPSIDACRAVVLQTANGLFGWHQAGGAYADRLNTYGNKLASYIRAHRLGNSVGIVLYVVTHVGARGGYGGTPGTVAGNAQQGREHLREIAAYAQAIGFTGTIRSYDLSMRWPGGSCYVEFDVNGNGCDVFANAWHTMGNETANFDPGRGDDHKNGHGATFVNPKLMFTKVNTTGRTKVETILI
jgi:hypothetical protein